MCNSFVSREEAIYFIRFKTQVSRRKTLSFPNNEEHQLFSDIENVLISEEQLKARIAELGKQISEDYKDKPLVLISILKGGVVFLADLMRAITIPHAFDLMGASSYKGTKSSGKVVITKDTELDIHGQHVLLVEDVLDSGRTLSVICDLLRIQGPASIEICCLLDKKKERSDKLNLKYKGFEISDEFVVGYGLDFNEHYRNLSCVGVLKKEVYSA